LTTVLTIVTTPRWCRRLPERTVPTEATTATALDVLHDDYDAWCTGNGLQAISHDAFTDEFVQCLPGGHQALMAPSALLLSRWTTDEGRCW
jgi:hypothetical protein